MAAISPNSEPAPTQDNSEHICNENEGISQMAIDRGDKYTDEEIDAMFVDLRTAQVEAMEVEHVRKSSQCQPDKKNVSSPPADYEVDEFVARILAEENEDDEAGAEKEISRQHFKFENGVWKETRSIMFRPEQYRLAFMPWTMTLDSKHSNGGDDIGIDKVKGIGIDALAQVEPRITLKKRMSDKQKMIFAGWIKIQNKSPDCYVSYNVNEYNPNIFTICQPVGILSPNESRDVLFKTTDAIPYRMIDLVHETFAVYIAPCQVIDLYAHVEVGKSSGERERHDIKKDETQVKSHSLGDHGHAVQENAKILEDELFATKITEQHILEFWSTYKTIWFPQAQIYNIKELCPRKQDWLKERSLLKTQLKKGLVSNAKQRIGDRRKDSKQHGAQVSTLGKEKHAKYTHVIFGQQTQRKATHNRLVFNLAGLCMVLFLLTNYSSLIYPLPFSPF